MHTLCSPPVALGFSLKTHHRQGGRAIRKRRAETPKVVPSMQRSSHPAISRDPVSRSMNVRTCPLNIPARVDVPGNIDVWIPSEILVVKCRFVVLRVGYVINSLAIYKVRVCAGVLTFRGPGFRCRIATGGSSDALRQGLVCQSRAVGVGIFPSRECNP